MDELQQHFGAWHHLVGLTQKDRRILFKHYPNPDEAYRSSDALHDLGFSAKACAAWGVFSSNPTQQPAWQCMQQWLPALSGVQILTVNDPLYPPLLREISDYPPLLYVCGDARVLSMPQLAVVGSRRCSYGAKELAFAFAKDIAAQGIAINSGGALGIDSAAHQGAVSRGKTIAVMGTGIDSRYPASNRDLYEQIEANGAIVTEFRPGVGAKPGHFPKRNRLIAGMSMGTLVVEAALRSGSLITARLALDYNREVFAIPGSVNDPRTKGTHELIKQGAKLTETSEDIFEEISFLAASTPQKTPTLKPPVAIEAAQLLEKVDFSFTTLDCIAKRACLPVATLLPQLIDLELSGHLLQQDGGYIRL